MKTKSKKILFILSLILPILLPLLTHIFFKIKVNEDCFTIAEWTASDFLSYCGEIIGSLILLFTVYYTMASTKEENDRIIQSTSEENKKIIDNSHYELQYSSFCNEVKNIISLLEKTDFTAIINFKINLEKHVSEIAKVKRELEACLISAELVLPSYAKKSFSDFVNYECYSFLNNLESIVSLYNKYHNVFNFEESYRTQFSEQRIFEQLCENIYYEEKRFLRACKINCFALIDCFFESANFIESNLTSDTGFLIAVNELSKIKDKYQKIIPEVK